MDMSPIIAELERLYEAIAADWLTHNESLAERPMITVASRGRKATVDGWYTPAVWADADDDVLGWLAGSGASSAVPEQQKRAEIVIAAEVLTDPVQTAAELARQMISHAFPSMRPKPGSYYYSALWGWRELSGIGVASVNPEQPSKGLSKWTPTQEFREWADANIKKEVFSAVRDKQQAVKKGSRMKKWTCGCTIVRCAVALRAVCEKCGNRFQWAEAEPFPWPGLYDPESAEPYGRIAHLYDGSQDASRKAG